MAEERDHGDEGLCHGVVGDFALGGGLHGGGASGEGVRPFGEEEGEVGG